jgi:hypothetical protein
MARERKSDPPPAPPVELTADDARKLAHAVIRIDEAVKTIASSGLNRRAIITLLHDATNVGKRDINDVLNGLEQLGELYLERANKKESKG